MSLDTATRAGTVICMTTPNSLPELSIDETTKCAIAVTDAEKLLLEKVKSGDEAIISTDLDIADADAWGIDQTIRSAFLRHVCLYPDLYNVDPWGIRISHSLIVGKLDFNSCGLAHPLSFIECRFDEQLEFEDAQTRFLGFTDCFLPGLNADSIIVSNSLWICDCIISNEVILQGSEINGSLYCEGTSFQLKEIQGELIKNDNEDLQNAINADGIKVGGDIILSNTKIIGGINISGSKISGDLSFDSSSISNPYNHTDDEPYALIAQRMIVKGRLFLTEMTSVIGRIDLRDAHVNSLVDDTTGWPKVGTLDIDCFTYNSLDDSSYSIDRLNWLDLMQTEVDENTPVFWPQPYEQLIKVLRLSGHEWDARRIAIAKHDRYQNYIHRQDVLANRLDDQLFLNDLEFNKKHEIKKQRSQLPANSSWHLRLIKLHKLLSGYGYAPWRALYFLLGALIVGNIVFAINNENGLMEPAKEKIYAHECYVNQSDCPHWLEIKHSAKNGDQRYVPPDYPDFNAFIYSLDVLVPIIDLKLENHWMPSSRGLWGTISRWYFWLHIAMGWIFTTIAVAGFTRLIKKD